jgi:hypothetical protein
MYNWSGALATAKCRCFVTQKLRVLSLRGVSVDLQQLPPRLEVGMWQMPHLLWYADGRPILWYSRHVLVVTDILQLLVSRCC